MLSKIVELLRPKSLIIDQPICCHFHRFRMEAAMAGAPPFFNDQQASIAEYTYMF